jgi:hypothetical protein
MALPKEFSIGIGLATATVVYGLYQNALPTMADVRSLDANNTDISAAERTASWTAAGVVAGVSLIAKDPTIFIIGGSMVVAMAWWHRHANMVVPNVGKATSEMTPRVTQASDPGAYATPTTPQYESTF